MSSKIAFVCNMNHMMFTLCRYMLDEGFDCHLFVFKDEAKHFLPDADCFDDSYFAYTTILNHKKEDFFLDDLTNTSSILKRYDFFIGTDLAPAFLYACGIRLDIFIPHGTDIFKIPFDSEVKRPSVVNRTWWLKSLFFNSKLQLAGINVTPTIIIDDEYNRFGYKNKLNPSINYISASPPMLYAPQYEKFEERNFEKLKSAKTFNELRAKYLLIIFSQSRHFWGNKDWEAKGNGKGNDVLIRGFAKFLHENNFPNACLVLYTYGANVENSKALIKELSIEENVVWMPVSDRKEIMFGLNISDIACGEFYRSWYFCGTVNEALFLNKPLIHFRDDIGQIRTNGYPVINVRNEIDISVYLKKFYNDRSVFIDQASKGKNWIIQFSVEPIVKIIKDLIQDKLKNQSSEINNSAEVGKLRKKIKGRLLLNKLFFKG